MTSSTSASKSTGDGANQGTAKSNMPDTMLSGKDGYVKKVDLRKLATHEDPYHLHKTLGILSLIHFIYRYFVVFPMNGHLGFEGTKFDWLFMTIHLALASSSLIFKVIKARLLKFPMIMWNEYRLHAIVFTLRCWSVFAMGYAVKFIPEVGQFSTTLPGRFVVFALVLAHHVLADQITTWYGTPGVTSVRVVKSKKTGKVKYGAMKMFYSFYQFMAIASHVSPNARMMDAGFNTLIAIQSSAFLMTLCRKNIITFRMHGIVYTTCLIMSAGHITFSMCSAGTLNGLFLLSSALAVFYMRVTFRLDKYLLWGMFSAWTHPSVYMPVSTAVMPYLDPILTMFWGLEMINTQIITGLVGVVMAAAMGKLLKSQFVTPTESSKSSSSASGKTNGATSSFLEGMLYLSGVRKPKQSLDSVTKIIKAGS